MNFQSFKDAFFKVCQHLRIEERLHHDDALVQAFSRALETNDQKKLDYVFSTNNHTFESYRALIVALNQKTDKAFYVSLNKDSESVNITDAQAKELLKMIKPSQAYGEIRRNLKTALKTALDKKPNQAISNKASLCLS